MKFGFNRNWHLFIFGAGIIMCVIAVYFGGSIYSAKNSAFTTHLDAMDKIYNYPVEMIPTLSKKAAYFTLPFILIISVLLILVFLKSKNLVRKRIAIGLMIAIFIVWTFDILTILNPQFFDFSNWGFVWMTMGIIIIGGNLFSYFLPEKV